MSAATARKDGTLLVTRGAAAEALSVSLRHFSRHVQGHLRLVRSGGRVLVPVTELERWIVENQDR